MFKDRNSNVILHVYKKKLYIYIHSSQYKRAREHRKMYIYRYFVIFIVFLEKNLWNIEFILM